MPGTPTSDQSNSAEVSKGLQPEDPSNVRRGEVPATAVLPPREITQTDQLNKKLLVSFLNRMNSQSNEDKSKDSDAEENDSDTSFDG